MQHEYQLPKKESALLSLLLIVLLPALTIFFDYFTEKGLVVSVANLFFSVVVALMPLLFFRPRVFFFLLVPFLLLMPAEVVHIKEYDGYSTLSALASMAESNLEETSGFISNYRPYFIALYSLVAFSIFFGWRYIKKDWVLGPMTKFAIVCFSLLVCLAFSLRTYTEQVDTDDVYKAQASLYHRIISESFPAGAVIRGFKYAQQRQLLEEYSKEKEGFIFGAKSAEVDDVVHIIVVGETSRSHNWSLDGYTRQTNPMLEQRRGVIFFTEAITNATHTRESVLLTLSRLSPNQYRDLYKEKSLISAFKEAGYQTYWLSNQNRMSFVDTPIYSFAKEASSVSFTDVDYQTNAVYDEVLLPELESYLGAKKQKSLIVIHTMGSHEVYRKRYPKEDEVYTPVPSGGDYNFVSEGFREKLVNSYDNSIIYTDFFIDSVISRLEASGREGTVTFFSDHGENLLDDEDERFGHGGVIPTSYVLDVPLLFWGTDGYWAKYPEKYEFLVRNSDAQVSLIDLFKTVLNLGEVSLSIDSGAGDDLSSQQLKKSRSRQVLNTNYDVLFHQEIIDAVDR